MTMAEIWAAVEAWGTSVKGWLRIQCFNLLCQSDSGETLNRIKELLIISPNDGIQMGKIYDYLLGIGYGLVLIYFLIDLTDKMLSTGRNPSLEQFIFAIFKLIIAETVLKYGATLLGYICDIGNSVVAYWANNTGNLPETTAYNQSLYEAINEWGVINCLLGCIIGLLIHVVAVIPNFMITLHAISRKMEIIIRGGFACIAIPDVFTEGLRSNCVRYMKKFAAVLLHGGVMALIIVLSQNLQVADTALVLNRSFTLTDFEVLLTPVLYSFAAVGTISASKSIINDAFGV